MTHKGSIYLAGRWLQGVPGGMLEVPAETLVALFTLQYCQNDRIRVVLVASRGNPKTCKFPVSVASLCFGVEVKDEEECPEVLCHCELPAMIPEEEKEEEEKIKKESGKKKDAIVNRNQIGSCQGEQLEEKEEEERKEEKEEDKKENEVKKRKQEVSDNCRETIQKQMMKKEEEEKEKEQKRKQDELKKSKQEEEEKEEEDRQDEREKQNQESHAENEEKEEDKEGNIKKEKEKSRENQKEKENTEIEGGGDSGCKNGDDDDDGDEWREGPWCCAGLCSSLRLAVKQAVETRTLETNRRNGRNTAANTNQDVGKRSNTRSNTGKTNEKACNTESSGSNTARNANINIGSVSNTTNNESNTATNATDINDESDNKSNTTNNQSNTASNTVDTDNQSNTTSNTSNKSGNTPHHAAALLGFRGGCLQACAEVSVWTKFCEVEAPAALLSLALAPYRGGEEVEYPRELLRYECHLRRPPILHNALKRTQRHIRETVKDGTERDELIRRPLAQLPPLNHQFAEGPDMTLADLMLFSCFHLLLASLTSSAVEPSAITPLVFAWHGTMALNGHVQMALPVLDDAKALLCGTPRPAVPPRVVVPSVPDVSIYKSDPERSRATRGAFTRQGDVEEVLRVVEGTGVEPEYTPWPPHSTSSSSSISSPSFTSSSSSPSSSTFTSTSSPFSFSLSTSSSSATSEPPPLHTLLPALSLEGHIPESRLARKVQQVENMCSAVLALARPGDVVVDFCSGGGHVGIPLAQCLPGCRVLLVENKVPSLERARERVRHLRLPNVWFMQTNLDYFRGGFDIGVSLHACGVATDLVLGKCVAQGAAFVVAPCCYGSIRPNHVVSYPRSQTFHSLPLTLDQYLTLGHAADQTHGRDNPKTEQGQQCMRLVDGDRLAAAKEVGYTAGLALMHPSTCSPKNHLLLGKPTP